jgi:cytochrome c oxidase assembly protein subunit 11
MFGFGFVLVPLYDVFCEVTGLNGKTGLIEEARQPANPRIDKTREVTVEFMANVNGSFPWEFKPVVNRIQVQPGEPRQVFFAAKNLAKQPVTGRAVPSVAPNRAAKYLNKIECFCFIEQRLDGGESKQMAVRFIVDPHLPRDVSILTLSYTFFGVEPRQTGATAPAYSEGSGLTAG